MVLGKLTGKYRFASVAIGDSRMKMITNLIGAIRIIRAKGNGNIERRTSSGTSGKFIICKGTDSTVKIFNRKTMKKENFSLQKHQGLLTYILEMVEMVNCQVVALPDLLLLVYGSWVVHKVLIKNGDLNFSFDLGVNSSKSINLDHSFLNYLRVVNLQLLLAQLQIDAMAY